MQDKVYNPQKTDYTKAEIESAAERLKPIYIAALRAYDGTRTYDQAAAVVGVSAVGTFKSRLNRARAALGKMLAAQS
jgi:DNA-directed RNA polymerase specialized sigma24 family protein